MNLVPLSLEQVPVEFNGDLYALVNLTPLFALLIQELAISE